MGYSNGPDMLVRKCSMPNLGKFSAIFTVIFATLVACQPIKAERTDNDENLEAMINGDQSFYEIDFCALRGKPFLEPLLSNELIEKINPEFSFSVKDERRFSLFKKAIETAAKSVDEKNCRVQLETGKSLAEEENLKHQVKFEDYSSIVNSDDLVIREIQSAIFEYAKRDQAARNSFIRFQGATSQDQTWAKLFSIWEMYSVDNESSTYMTGILNNIDWVNTSTYGEYISYFAWLLVQHADHDTELQELALKRLEPLLESHEVSRSDYAYLVDRVAVNTGEKQTYGTQSTGKCVNGKPELRPLKQPEKIETLRKEAGLKPLDQYLQQLSRTVCPNQ